ncbi:hypothetical protein BDR26DRAFT_869938 [Obelidium mucronatum]|nr:hypothetical protein BDR26DRAFT_869938 [Obelidium mucronatum]
MSQTSGTLFSLGRRDREGGDKKTQPVRTTSRMPFIWDSPQLDQILVFEERNIHRILHVAITELRPTKLSLGKPIPANIIFLGARYAHYLSSMELLDEFLGEAVKAICKEVKTQGDNVHTLSFWISNCTHLLYYFQKDPSLRLSTFKYQRIFAELVQELYDLTVAFVRGEVLTILDAAVLDFADSEAIPIVSTTVLEKQPPVTVSATSRIKRASWILYKQTNDLFSNAVRAAAKVGSMAIPSSQLYQQQKRFRTVIPSPSANALLNNRCCHIYGSSTLLNKKEEPNSPIPPISQLHQQAPTPALPLVPHSLQPTPKKTRYTSKPPTPKTQLLHQILTTINQSLFEGLLNPTRYNRSFTDAWSTRSRAVAIRINLSSLETWIRDNETHISPASMARTTDSGSDTVTEDSQRLEAESFYNSHPLIPTFQLMQYLHVLTSLDSLEAYLRILPSLPHVSFETQKRVLNVYRCEENEEGVCEDVKMYVEEMEIMAKRVKEVEEKEREEKEPGLVLFDLSCSSGLESGDELDDLVQSSAAKTTRLSNSWESKVFPFAVPMFENDRLEREMEEWKEVGRPHVPPLVLRMLDGGSGMTGLDEEEEEDGID